MPTAEAWQLSNAPVLNMAVHKVALDLFEEAGMDALEGVLRLTAYLEQVVQGAAQRTRTHLEIWTPGDPAQRGCQLSIVAHGKGGPRLTTSGPRRGGGLARACGHSHGACAVVQQLRGHRPLRQGA